MCFVAGDFLHDVQEIYGREEIPKRKYSDGFFGWRRCGVSQFVHFRSVITLRRVRDGFLCRCSGGVFRSWLWSWSVSSNGRRNRHPRWLPTHRRSWRQTLAGDGLNAGGRNERNFKEYWLVIGTIASARESTHPSSSRSFFCATA